LTFVAELEPRELWEHFDQILTIPRGSGNEGAIRDYVIGVAQRRSLNYKQDDVGNLVLRKRATGGHEQAGGTVLQCHLDMVNEKNSDVLHDFSKDPIKPRKDGDYLMAQGTTLGSDNGIGIAAALAVLESESLQHGPLEALFTVDEETGLTGASGLSSDILKGTYLINLDSEEEGALYVGCAGGAGIDLVLPLRWEDPREDQKVIGVTIGGLSGGHSGIDIHLQRGNAISILARCLNALHRNHGFRLANIGGGNMHNAIPRESKAQLLVAAAGIEELKKDLIQVFQQVADEYKRTDAGLEMKLSTAQPPTSAFDAETTSKLLSLLVILPHGVARMSNDIAGLVETSSNLATASVEGDQLLIHVSNRSSVESALSGIQERVIAIGRLAGSETEWVEGYPGWQPDMDSPLLQLVQKVHEETLGFPPESKAVHAGLECGIIKQKYPQMDAISFGPQIEFPHSPDERIKINSAGSFFKLLVAVLKEIGRM
jgi:dipeptidase D